MIFALRAVLTTLWFFGFSLVALLLSLLRPFHPGNSYVFCKMMCPLGLRLLGIRIRGEHLERARASYPSIITANHQSFLDVFVFGETLPPRFVCIGKKSLRNIPIWGWLFYLCGNLLIDRGNNESAVGTMQSVTRQFLEKKFNVFIMPEGTRSGKKGLGPFKKGAFYLAIDTQAPIQPIVACSYFKAINLKRLHAGTVPVRALEPISTKGKTRDDVDALIQETHQKMAAAIAELDREADQGEGSV